jgi:O-acetylhomoserine/O-acetylserine sulfhydrylase-like pyridoxal-dependent enzyme
MFELAGVLVSTLVAGHSNAVAGVLILKGLFDWKPPCNWTLACADPGGAGSINVNTLSLKLHVMLLPGSRV